MSRQSLDVAPDITIQASRFTRKGYFKPRALCREINEITHQDDGNPLRNQAFSSQYNNANLTTKCSSLKIQFFNSRKT